jgi:hypothetical protein
MVKGFSMLTRSLLLVIFLLNLNQMVHADEPSPISVHLTIGSVNKQNVFLKNGAPQNDSKGPLNLRSKMARLYFLDHERIRIELLQPIHLLIPSANSESKPAEAIFRSFVIRAPAVDVNRVKKITTGTLISYDSFNTEDIEDFIENTRRDGFDNQIRDVLLGYDLPEVQKFTGLQFFVPFEHIGKPEGAKVYHLSILSESVTSLPWQYPTENTLNSPARDIQFIYSPNDPLITEYLNSINQMMARKIELENLGWLKNLNRTERFLEKDINKLKNIPENLVVFSARPRCQLLFQ